MSIRSGHKPLSSGAATWLVALSDPMGCTSRPTRPISSDELDVVVEAASAHGVLPAIARGLQTSPIDGPSIVGGDSARLVLAAAVRTVSERAAVLTGQCLLLEHHARRISTVFADASLPAAIVKGPVFARRLYPTSADRSFTDIDILLEPAALDASSEILRTLGLVPAAGLLPSGRDYNEHKWIVPGKPFVLVEVQTDLIHSPRLRRGIRFRYADLLAAGDGDATDATALLMLAAVHGAAGHQFERLQPVVDVLQATRRMAGAVDARRLRRVATATGSAAALHAALDLTARLFNEPAAAELAGAFDVRWGSVRRRLVSPAVVLRSQSRAARRDSWRRRVLREMIWRIGLPDA